MPCRGATARLTLERDHEKPRTPPLVLLGDRAAHVVCTRHAGGIHDGVRGHRAVACLRPAVPLFRHVAAPDQYRHHHRHLPDGVPRAEHAEPRCARVAPEDGRGSAQPRPRAQSPDQPRELLGRGDRPDCTPVSRPARTRTPRWETVA